MSEPNGVEAAFVFTILCCGDDEASVVSEILWSRGVQGIEEIGDSRGPVQLRSSFGVDRQQTESILSQVLISLPHLTWEVREVDPTVADSWKQFAQPIRVSRDLTIVPSWFSETVADSARRSIWIDPGSTFGMGDHPSTLGSLQMLLRWMKSDEDVLDVGCGSGILGIASLVHGARRALGTDINPASLSVSVANAELNGVGPQWSVSLQSLEEIEERFQIITANILAPVLVDLAEDLKRLLADEGTLIISGVLRHGCAHVLQALEPLHVVDEIDVDGWATFALRR